MLALDAADGMGEGAAAPAPAAGAGGHAPVLATAGDDSWFFKKFAFGATVSPLGISVGSATSLTRGVNMRVQGNFFNYSFNQSISGVNFDATASLRSIQGQFDWFPFQRSSFHVSPGVLFYNQNEITGNGLVTQNESITFNDTDYYSQSTDPLHGTGGVFFRKTSPMLTVGWGNWVPRRREKHLTFPIDVGFAYVGDPKIDITMAGSVCQGAHDFECGPVQTDPSFQSNLNAQIAKYRQDLNVIRFYPVISTGIVYKF
ncbi:hypothetical protein [Silvibacterium acidisoli]|uniref:hypothetical protein n=1 Tax=Acidobacteriaceae bacterium ZG23-2 TaxID=2883246 RepID=UPI00406C1187